jgi:catalase
MTKSYDDARTVSMLTNFAALPLNIGRLSLHLNIQDEMTENAQQETPSHHSCHPPEYEEFIDQKDSVKKKVD